MVMTTSASLTAAGMVLATAAPRGRKLSRAAATMSNTVKRWPAFKRFRAIGAPMLPRPRNAIRCMIAPEKSVQIVQRVLATGPSRLSEVLREPLRGDGLQAVRCPARLSAFLDQQRPYALAKVGVRATLHRDHQLHTQDISQAEGEGSSVKLPDQRGTRRRPARQGIRRALQPLILTTRVPDPFHGVREVPVSEKGIDRDG